MKFHDNPFSGGRDVTSGQTEGLTDTTNVIVAFRNLANAPKKLYLWRNVTISVQSAGASSLLFTKQTHQNARIATVVCVCVCVYVWCDVCVVWCDVCVVWCVCVMYVCVCVCGVCVCMWDSSDSEGGK